MNRIVFASVSVLAVVFLGLGACGHADSPAGAAPSARPGSDSGGGESRTPDHDAGEGRPSSAGGAGGRADGSLADGGDLAPAEILRGIFAEPQDGAAFLWNDDALRTFELHLTPSDLAFLDANPAAEQYVNGELRFEGEIYEQVGIRYKGSVGAFLQPCTSARSIGVRGGPRVGKCSIKVSFNWSDPEGRFHGLKKLLFHSLGKDPSLMRERLGYSLFREMGLAAPRAVHVRVLVNGQYAGVYGLIEEIDGRFTRSRFTEGGEGNLYKEVWPVYEDEQSYLNALETNEDENPSVQQMLDFKSAIETGPAAADAWLDPDVVAHYLAVDRVLINDDGVMHFYCTPGFDAIRGFGNHNYYWYFAENEARVWLIPWDLDISMRRDGFAQVYTEWSDHTAECTCRVYPQQAGNPLGQFPPSCDPLIRGWATHRDAYDRAVDAFLAGPFSAESVNEKIDAWTEQVRNAVEEQAEAGIIAYEDRALTPDDWQAGLDSLQQELESMRLNRGYAY